MLAKPLKTADGHRVTKTLNTRSHLGIGVRFGWRNDIGEARPTGNLPGGRGVRISLKIDTARKPQAVETDLVMSTGRQHRTACHGKHASDYLCDWFHITQDYEYNFSE